MLSTLLPLLPLLTVTAATPALISKNLNYRSPYIAHPALGIDVEAVHARHLEARSKVDTEITKRQVQVARPSGTADDYPTPNYGLGVTDWDNAGYVYGGNLNFTHNVASGKSFQLIVDAVAYKIR